MFVFLLEISLCFVFLDLCSCDCVLVFCVLGLCFVYWVCVHGSVHGSVFLLFLFLSFLDLDLDLGFFKKILWACDFLFSILFLIFFI